MTLYDDAARQVRDAHRRVRRVHMLSAGTRRSIGVDAQILGIDILVRAFLKHRINADRAKTRVPSRVRVEGRDAHKTMHAVFLPEPAVSVRTAHFQHERLDARLLAVAYAQRLGFKVAPFAPARVHAQQHLRPILRFGSPRTCVEFEVAIVAVFLLAQQGLQTQPLGAFRNGVELTLRLTVFLGIVRLAGKREQRAGIRVVVGKRGAVIEHALDAPSFFENVLSFIRIVPQAAVLRLRFELVQFFLRLLVVKASPSASPTSSRPLAVWLEGRTNPCSCFYPWAL